MLPWSSIVEEGVMGSTWDRDMLHHSLIANLHELSMKLLVTLMRKEVIRKEHDTCQDFLAARHSNGHATLHSVASTTHSALAKNHDELSILSQSCTNTFGSHISAFMEWFRRTEHRDCMHHRFNKIELTARNLRALCSDLFITRLENCYTFYQD